MAAPIKQLRERKKTVRMRKYVIDFKARGVLVGFCGFKWIRGYLVYCSVVVMHILCVYQSSCCSCSSLGCSISSPSKGGGVSSSGFSLSWSVSNPW